MPVTAVFGGTFNPFHIGHYEILEKLCECDFIEKVLVMPDKIPPHKVCDFMAADKDRIEMCRIVCEDFDKAELCLIEFEREGKSYTIDTVKLLKERFPNENFSVVCGGDMIATLDTWYNYDKLFSITSFIAFSRDNSEEFRRNIEKMTKLGADIRVIDAHITDVSSSKLRLNMDEHLIPERVYKYILEKGIYDEHNNETI